MTALLHLERLTAGYGPLSVLKEVSLEVGEGEMVTLIGANGAGKTTTLLSISGCLRPRSGRIVFAGQAIDRMPAHLLVGRGLCHAPEGRRIFPRMTVAENLELGAYHRRDRAAVRRDRDRAYEQFPLLGQRRRQLGGTLSGGEQQMLALARAWMSRPRLLLLDEPSLGLAPRLVAQVFETLRELHAQGMAMLLVEQHARQALAHAQRGYVMEQGRIALEGRASQLVSDARVRRAYLGA